MNVVVILKGRCYNEEHIEAFDTIMYEKFGNKFQYSSCIRQPEGWWECKWWTEDVSKEEVIEASFSLKATHIEIDMEVVDEE